MIAFLKRCWQRRWIRGLVWTCITVVTVMTLFVTWVNWTGARGWAEAERRVRDEKLTLQFRHTLLDAVPDTENFCAIPLLRDISIVVDRDPAKGEPAAKRKALEALGIPDDGETLSAGKKPPSHRAPGEDATKHLSDWARWFREMKAPMPVTDPQNPAREIWAALAYQDAAVAQMTAVLDRPRAQFQPAPEDREYPDMIFSMQIPHYTALHRAGAGLALRAEAATRLGDAARAHEVTRILARLSEATSEEPFLIGLMVSRTLATYATQATWALCEERTGTAEDFRKLQRDLERLKFGEAALRAWEGELAAGVDALRYLKQSRDSDLLSAIGPMTGAKKSSGGGFVPRLLPAGLFDMNAANMVHMELDYVIRPLRDQGWQAVLALQPEMERTFKNAKVHWPTNLDKVFPVLLMPSASSITSTSVYGQCLVNQAIIACALERYFAEKQAYPETLASLKRTDGTALPLDPANGEPMKYRKTADGRYKLWSVGFDLADDGGKGPAKGVEGDAAKPSNIKYRGDWGWEYAVGE